MKRLELYAVPFTSGGEKKVYSVFAYSSYRAGLIALENISDDCGIDFREIRKSENMDVSSERGTTFMLNAIVNRLGR